MIIKRAPVPDKDPQGLATAIENLGDHDTELLAEVYTNLDGDLTEITLLQDGNRKVELVQDRSVFAVR